MRIGRFTLTRDSVVLWLGVAGAVLGYLRSVPAPWLWTYDQWIAAACAAVMGLFFKLQSSPLKHSDEANYITRGK
jgi:hypothetical protein